MKKQLALTSLLAVFVAQSACASVTINFGMGNMFSNTIGSVSYPVGGRLNLLALDSGTWSTAFPDLIGALSSNTASFTLPGTTLVGSIANDDAGGPGSTSGSFIFSYSGAFGAGDQLLIVAYPSLTLASSSPGVGAPGFFFRTDSIIDGSDIAYVAPADGFAYNLGSYTPAGGGDGTITNNLQFAAGAGSSAGNGTGYIGGGFTTVPEPSTYALLAMGAAALGGYVIRRRKRD